MGDVFILLLLYVDGEYRFANAVGDPFNEAYGWDRPLTLLLLLIVLGEPAGR